MTDSTVSLDQTREWVERFVVAHNICPFARRELERGSIRYVATSAESFETTLLTLIEECRRLDVDPTIETTLLVLPQGVEDFDDYLDLLGLAETLLEEQGYAGTYQLASFHPGYCFHGVEENDPANYTNRSPWPMLHLLREASIEGVLTGFAHPERIPERNAVLLREMGNERLVAQIEALFPLKSRN